MTAKQIIFIISLPRSGSTLLQKILANHSKIASIGEPWLLLPLLYSDPENSFKIPKKEIYNGSWARSAIKKALNVSDNRSQLLKKMGANAYSTFVNEISQRFDNPKYFLDKTPRYYLILREIEEYFPKAKKIILYRDPLDIFYSILTTWVKKEYFVLYNYKVDLTSGIDQMHYALSLNNENYLHIHYESLINSPMDTVKHICKFLNLTFEEKMIEYSSIKNQSYDIGDTKIYNKKNIEKSNNSKWLKEAVSKKEIFLLEKLLKQIGPQKYSAFGYDYEKSLTALNKLSVGKNLIRLWNPLKFYLSKFAYIPCQIIIKKRILFNKISSI